MDNSNTQIVPFTFESFNVRIITDANGEPLFVAKDVCESLEYKDTVNAIKQHCKGVAKYHPLETAGGTQNVRVIREPDLYRLIAGSNLPSAERFEKWLFEEVLPSIRKTGRYEVQPAKAKTDRALAREVKEVFNCFFSIARTCKFDGNMAILSANQATLAFTGINPLAVMGRISLEAEEQEQLLIVSEIAARLDWPPRIVNPRLTESELQTEYRDHKKRLCYELSEMGRAFGVYVDTGKKHGDGSPVRQIKWRASVVEFLNQRYPVGEDAA
jgi:prophage antirepressor-like protein